MAAAGLLSVLLIICIVVLSRLLFKAKQELFGIKSGGKRMQSEAVSRLSPGSESTVDTRENIAYEHVTSIM